MFFYSRMTFMTYNSQSLRQENESYFNGQTIFLEFNRSVKGFIFFHCFSLLFLFMQFGLLIVLSNIMPKSYPHGIVIASFIISLSCYFALSQFLESKKLIQMEALLEKAVSSDQKPPQKEELFERFYQIKNLLYLFNYQINQFLFESNRPHFFTRILTLFYTRFLKGLKEVFYKAMAQCLVTIIQNDPTDLKAHSEFTGALLSQTDIYQFDKSKTAFFFTSMVRAYESPSMKKNLSLLYNLAIEELKILNALSPHDPWTHAKLADCYHELGLIESEIKEYEMLKELRPTDKEILLKLGELYFLSKRYAEGIKIHEELSKFDLSLAKGLMLRFKAHEELFKF